MVERKEPLANVRVTASKILNSIVDAVVTTDLSGRLLKGNEAAYKMFGVVNGTGRTVTEFIVERDVRKTMKEFTRCISKGVGMNVEVTAVAEDGGEFPVRVNGSLLEDEKGEPVGVVLVVRDITELKHLQEKEREAAVMAAAEKARTQEAENARKIIEKRAAKLDQTRKKLKRRIRDLQQFQLMLIRREKQLIELKEELEDMKQLENLEQILKVLEAP